MVAVNQDIVAALTQMGYAKTEAVQVAGQASSLQDAIEFMKKQDPGFQRQATGSTRDGSSSPVFSRGCTPDSEPVTPIYESESDIYVCSISAQPFPYLAAVAQQGQAMLPRVVDSIVYESDIYVCSISAQPSPYLATMAQQGRAMLPCVVDSIVYESDIYVCSMNAGGD